MCKQGTEQEIWVKIPADLSHTSKEYWKFAKIDDCIAPLVAALQQAGIDMRGSCCGHGKRPGDIHLQDGRLLVILSSTKGAWQFLEAFDEQRKAEASEVR